MFRPWSSLLKTATILLAFAAGLASSDSLGSDQFIPTNCEHSFNEIVQPELKTQSNHISVKNGDGSMAKFDLLEDGKVHVADFLRSTVQIRGRPCF